MVTIEEENYLSLLTKTITYNVSQTIIDLENNQELHRNGQNRKIKAEIERRKSEIKSQIAELGNFESDRLGLFHDIYLYDDILSFINSLEAEDVDLEEEVVDDDPHIAVGTKIRLKTNPNVILSIISNDCHGDEFECSDGSVLSLKQLEKYYDLI